MDYSINQSVCASSNSEEIMYITFTSLVSLVLAHVPILKVQNTEAVTEISRNYTVLELS